MEDSGTSSSVQCIKEVGPLTCMWSWLIARLGQELPLSCSTTQCHPRGYCTHWRPCKCDVLPQGDPGLEPCPIDFNPISTKPLASSFKTCPLLHSHKPITALLTISVQETARILSRIVWSSLRRQEGRGGVIALEDTFSRLRIPPFWDATRRRQPLPYILGTPPPIHAHTHIQPYTDPKAR